MNTVKVMRYNWVDWTKATCIILMVCGHSGCNKSFHDFIYLFHMPVFFIISGFLYKRKAWDVLSRSLLIPTLIWNCFNYPYYIIMYLLRTGNNLNFNTLICQPFMGLFFHDFEIGHPLCGAFWFVLTLFIIRCLYQALENKACPNLIFCIICVLYAFFENGHPQYTYLFLIQKALIAYPFFYIGNHLKKNIVMLNHIDKYSIFYFVATLISLLLFVSTIGSFDLYSCQLNIFPTYYIMGFLGFIFLFSLFTNFKVSSYPPSLSNVIRNISNGTLVILGLHTMGLSFWSHLFKYIGYTNFSFCGEIFTILTIMLIYYPMIFILNRLPILVGKSY